MTDAEYRNIIAIHGTRVANRAVLLGTEMDSRQLSDFYDCYGPDDALPAVERCGTGLIHSFDPSGWFGRYANLPSMALWPEPDLGKEAASDAPDTSAEMLPIKVQQAAHMICSSLEGLTDLDQIRTRGDSMIAEQAAAIAARFRIDLDEALDLVREAAETEMNARVEAD